MSPTDSDITEKQWEIAKDLGWTDCLPMSLFGSLVKQIDQAFSRLAGNEPARLQFPTTRTAVDAGKPFFALTNQFVLTVSREYVGEKPVYKSNYGIMQASEDYQETLSAFIHTLTKDRDAAVFCKVTEMPNDFDIKRNSIMTSCSAECDIFLPTGLSRGMSRQNGSHVTDTEVFASIVSDYIKVMSKIQKHGYSLRAFFYLTRPADIQKILHNPESATEIWNDKGFRDYRCVSISEKGEIKLLLRQEIKRMRGLQ